MKTRVAIKLSGVDYFLRLLTVQDIHEIGEYLYEDQRQQLVDDAKAAGLSPESTMDRVSTLREEWSNGVEVLRQAYTRVGAQKFIQYALKNEGEDIEIANKESDLEALVRASTALCGLPDPFSGEDAPTKVKDEDEEEIFDDQAEGQSVETGTMNSH
jgi:hypothetical protein